MGNESVCFSQQGGEGWGGVGGDLLEKNKFYFILLKKVCERNRAKRGGSEMVGGLRSYEARATSTSSSPPPDPRMMLGLISLSIHSRAGPHILSIIWGFQPPNYSYRVHPC